MCARCVASLCLLFTGCAGAQPNPVAGARGGPRLTPPPIVVEGKRPVVATVGEVEIGVDEFLVECMHEDSALMRQALERLVLGRLSSGQAVRAQRTPFSDTASRFRGPVALPSASSSAPASWC